MKYNFIFLFFTIISCSSVCASTQDGIRVKATLVSNKVFLEGWLEQFNTNKPMVLQFKIREGQVVFDLPFSVQPGVYRLHLDSTNKKNYIDFIVDGIENEIVFDIKLNDFEVRPVFYISDENIKWYNYLKSTKKHVSRLNSLFQYLSVFHNELIDRLVIKAYTTERSRYYNLFSKFCRENGTTWAGLLVENRPLLFF
jgi:hypothetical protein